ncbi:MAG: EAL domain-containing protein [Clostridia bacterium]|nr:EAL domain-containing protein [Clostridia bacterium]
MSNSLIRKISNIIPTIKKHSTEKRFVKKIRNGFEANEFKMYLQFLVDVKTGEFTGAEALSRWHTASGEVIMPEDYIAKMENTGLIIKLDYYMLDKVCARLSEWKDSEFSDISISCNVTRLTISETDFLSNVKAIADRYNFDRSKLIMEITEDAIETNIGVATDNVKGIKKLGFIVALDDIGAGSSSLVNLCDYSVDVVKIDRKILLMASEEQGKRLLCGIVSLAHNLGMRVVCEGVETEEQNKLARDSGCDYIQGWYYSKAIPEKSIVARASAKAADCKDDENLDLRS